MMSHLSASSSNVTSGMSNSGVGLMSDAAIHSNPSMPFINARPTALPIAPSPAMPTVCVCLVDDAVIIFAFLSRFVGVMQ